MNLYKKSIFDESLFSTQFDLVYCTQILIN